MIADDAVVDPEASIGAFAVIESGARIAAGVTVGPHCFIGARCEIGEGGWLAPRVTLYHDVRIGKRVVIQSGAVLESSFVAEVKSDLMGEQTILCGVAAGAGCSSTTGYPTFCV